MTFSELVLMALRWILELKASCCSFLSPHHWTNIYYNTVFLFMCCLNHIVWSTCRAGIIFSFCLVTWQREEKKTASSHHSFIRDWAARVCYNSHICPHYSGHSLHKESWLHPRDKCWIVGAPSLDLLSDVSSRVLNKITSKRRSRGRGKN